MTQLESAPVGLSSPRPTGAWLPPLVFLLLLALPLVGHGCHGDDVDHEPTVKPPVYNER